MKKLRDSVADKRRRITAAWSGLLQHVMDEVINQSWTAARLCES